MVAGDAKQSSGLGAYKLAIVAAEQVVFGMGRMYQMLTERNLPHVAVFKDYDAAVHWLGITIETS